METRCTGHCCKRFVLSVTYEELEQSAEAERAGATHWTDKLGKERSLLAQGAQVFDMVIKLEQNENDKLHISPEHMQRYSCKNLDTDNNCTIYETRPNLCKTHGQEDGSCTYAGCTLVPMKKVKRDAKTTKTVVYDEDS